MSVLELFHFFIGIFTAVSTVGMQFVQGRSLFFDRLNLLVKYLAVIGIDCNQQDCTCTGTCSKLNYYLDGDVSGDPVTIEYCYNPDNHLTAYTTTGGPTFSFDASDSGDIDGLGRLISADEELTKVAGGTRTHSLSYTYDMRSQLTNATITNIGTGNWSSEYKYKKDGNVYERTIQSTQTDFEYDADDDGNDDGDLMIKATSGGSPVFELDWDDNGNMKDLPDGSVTTDLVYNWDNKLRKATIDSSYVLKAKYSPDGNRIWKESSDGSQYKYIVDTVGLMPVVLLVLDADSSNAVLNSFIYDENSRILTQYDGDWRAGADKYFYLNDRLGSVRHILDDTTGAVSRYEYDLFGNVFDADNEDECEIDANLDNSFMFTGQWFDDEIDQYYLRARMYKPHINRFSTRDTVDGTFEQPLTLHVYLYCANDPINRIDPHGLWAFYITETLFAEVGLARVKQSGYVIDDGNIGFITIEGEGGGTLGAGYGVSYGWSPVADTIYDLAGPAWTVGGSLEPGFTSYGFESFVGDNGIWGYEFTATPGSPLREAHVLRTHTTIKLFALFDFL